MARGVAAVALLGVLIAGGARISQAAAKNPRVSVTTRPATSAPQPARHGLDAVLLSTESAASRDTAAACKTQRPAPGGADSARMRAQKAMADKADMLQVSADEYNGWKTFHVYCYRCHGVDALGSDIAPHLIKSLQETVTHDCFVATVTNGRPGTAMPTWGAGANPLLDKQQIEEVYAYVKARSDGRLAAGRPHRATPTN